MIPRNVVLSAGLIGLLAVPPAVAQLRDPIPAPIPQSTIAVKLTPVATGLVAPCQLVVPGWGNRAFVVDQTRRVLLLKNGALQPTPLLDLSGVIAGLPPTSARAPAGLSPGYHERGLLALAFHPGFLHPQSAGYHTLYTLQ